MAVYAADAQAMDYNIGRVLYPLCFWVFATWLTISGVIYPCEDSSGVGSYAGGGFELCLVIVNESLVEPSFAKNLPVSTFSSSVNAKSKYPCP